MATCTIWVNTRLCGKPVAELTAAELTARGVALRCPRHAALYYLLLAKASLHCLHRAHPELRELREDSAYDYVRYAENCLSGME